LKKEAERTVSNSYHYQIFKLHIFFINYKTSITKIHPCFHQCSLCWTVTELFFLMTKLPSNMLMQ